MKGDPQFQRDCWKFVVATLGANSDDAAAYYACNKCGTRWGHLTLFEQETRTWCASCMESARGVKVDPIRPAWWKGDPPGYVDPWAVARRQPEPEPKPKYTAMEIGAMVDKSARAIQRGKRDKGNITRWHSEAAARLVQKRLADEGIDYTVAQLCKMRRSFAGSRRASAYYRKKKQNQGAEK